MFRFFYNMIIHLFGGLVLLRGKRGIKTYFGSDFPTLSKESIWIHAVSVGEARAAIPVIQWIKQHYPDTPIVMTSVTKTGHEEVKRSLPEVDHAHYLPLDLGWVMRRIVAKVKPKLLIVTETDYWYLLMDEVKRRGGKILVMNGKLSAKSAWWYHHMTPVAHHLFRIVDHFCVQDQIHLKRYQEVGAPADCIEVTGNIKLDAELPVFDADELRAKLKLSTSDKVVTIGSTHDPEERQILKSLKGDYKILLVPRHPERFDQVAAMLQKRGIAYGRYSGELTGQERVILIDAMGVLLRCYQISDVAIVAGSFTKKVGGHNVIEPLWYGVPVAFGPYMQSQKTLCELALTHKAGIQTPISGLNEAVEELIKHPQSYRRGGQELLAATKGSVERTCRKIRDLVDSVSH